MTTKKRNPQDATFRNINALKKRVARLEVALRKLVLRKKEISRGCQSLVEKDVIMSNLDKRKSTEAAIRSWLALAYDKRVVLAHNATGIIWLGELRSDGQSYELGYLDLASLIKNEAKK